jgi:hypothetical protein
MLAHDATRPIAVLPAARPPPATGLLPLDNMRMSDQHTCGIGQQR